MLNPRKAYLTAIFLFAAAGTLAACGDESGSSESGTTSSSAASTGGEGGSGQGGAGQGGAGGAESCVPGDVPAKTIKGMVSFTGTAMKGDSLKVVAFKNGDPASGAPAGYVFTDAQSPPTFPYAYEFPITLPPEGTGQFGIFAFLDVGNDNPMAPDMAEDPSAPPSMLVTVDDCKGATVDITLVAPK